MYYCNKSCIIAINHGPPPPRITAPPYIIAIIHVLLQSIMHPIIQCKFLVESVTAPNASRPFRAARNEAQGRKSQQRALAAGPDAPIRDRSRMEATGPAARARCCDFRRCASFPRCPGRPGRIGRGHAFHQKLTPFIRCSNPGGRAPGFITTIHGGAHELLQ